MTHGKVKKNTKIITGRKKWVVVDCMWLLLSSWMKLETDMCDVETENGYERTTNG